MDNFSLTPTIDSNPTLELAELQYAPADSRATVATIAGVLGTILSTAAAAGFLLLVALYNGFPTVFSDTGSYLLTGALHLAYAPFRAPGYGVFTRVASLGRSPWFIVAAQALCVAFVLREACDFLIGGGRKFVNACLLASAVALTALTSLPWLVSLLMPDVFAGTAFLCAYLLASEDEMRPLQRIALASILAISVAAHSSLFPIMGLFIAALMAMRLFARHDWELPAARSVLAWLLVPVIAAGVWTANQNQGMKLGFRLSPSGNSFLLGRLFGDGLAAGYLRESCPQRHFISCRYLSNLPRNEAQFLFWHPLFHDLKGHEREIDTIVGETLRTYPEDFLLSSARQTLLQLVNFRTGEEIRSNAAQDWNVDAIKRVFPGDLQAFRNSRQNRDNRMLPLAAALSVIDVTFFCLCFAACLALARTAGFARINRFLAMAIVFLVINAAVCGSLAGVYDRYQSRVAWLIPFCLLAYACSFVQRRNRGDVAADFIPT
jgi:hypothetical protein